MTAPFELPPTRENFARLCEAHRPHLRRHCYRMMAGLNDADDLVQETFLRAWRGFDGFAGGSFRGWLYRIATHACLDEIARRANARRWLPHQHDPGRRADPGPASDIAWLEPFPEADEIADEQPGPEARYAERQAVRLAFVAAIQALPARPRAALLLCDVLGWPAAEAAATLDVSLPALNSGLQRARKTLAELDPDAPARAAATTTEADLLGRYMRAWEAHDVDALVAVLKHDAFCVMPPYRLWLPRRADIAGFFAQAWAACPGLRLLAASANAQPAAAVYQRDGGRYVANALHVLTQAGDSIAAMTLFLDGSGKLFEAFGLPRSLEA